ncbi:MAG: AzlD domain-containing protein [Pseudomonadota bacterium]
MSLDPSTFMAIVAMGVATYLTRLTGWLLAARLVLEGRRKAVVEAIPGCMLISVIAPLVLLNGPADFLAGVVTALAAWRLPMVAVLIVGIAAAGLFRMLLL